MRGLVRSLIPRQVKRFIDRWRIDQIQREYASLSLSAAFDRIYATDAWALAGSTALSSGIGSSGDYVEKYGALLKQLLQSYQLESVADLGCGNFNTGRVISSLIGHYIGVDIAQPVVEANTKAYARDCISFVRADLTRDPLPPADAAILRQVLQHLTNAEIRAVLDNVLNTYSLTIITEHVYLGAGARPNLDIPHGPGTRVHMKSGVLVDLPPFSLSAVPVGDIECGPDEVLRTWAVQRPGNG